MDAQAKPPVVETAEGRCALRTKRRSFCFVCAYRHDCCYLALDVHPTCVVAVVGSV